MNGREFVIVLALGWRHSQLPMINSICSRKWWLSKPSALINLCLAWWTTAQPWWEKKDNSSSLMFVEPWKQPSMSQLHKNPSSSCKPNNTTWTSAMNGRNALKRWTWNVPTSAWMNATNNKFEKKLKKQHVKVIGWWLRIAGGIVPWKNVWKTFKIIIKISVSGVLFALVVNHPIKWWLIVWRCLCNQSLNLKIQWCGSGRNVHGFPNVRNHKNVWKLCMVAVYCMLWWWRDKNVNLVLGMLTLVSQMLTLIAVVEWWCTCSTIVNRLIGVGYSTWLVKSCMEDQLWWNKISALCDNWPDCALIHKWWNQVIVSAVTMLWSCPKLKPINNIWNAFRNYHLSCT